MNRKKLVRLIFERKSFLCVGLDPEFSKMPPHLLSHREPIVEFNRQIVEATRHLAVAYKLNLAFYESHGVRGWRALEKTVRLIGRQHFIVADAKRGDIGNTSKMYADAFFKSLKCDAITVAPYMGEDSLRPFLDYPKKWTIILALTSNAGSRDFQLTPQADTGELLFEKVIRRCAGWGSPDNTMFVVGATHPTAFRQVRAICPQHFLLVPGVGTQGGKLADICQHGMTRDAGLLVNASRSIIYASSGKDFADAAAHQASLLQQEMALLLPRR